MWVMKLSWGSCSTEKWQAFSRTGESQEIGLHHTLKAWDVNSTQQAVCDVTHCAGYRGWRLATKKVQRINHTSLFWLTIKGCQKTWIEASEGNDILSNFSNESQNEESGNDVPAVCFKSITIERTSRPELLVFSTRCGASAVRCFNKLCLPLSKRPQSGGNNGSRKSSPPLQYSSFKGGCH